MSSISTSPASELRYIRQGQGPEVLLIAGLSDPAEAWQAQLDGLSDRYTVTAFDNRGAGRSPLPADGPLTVESMADDAAGLLDHLGIERAHVAGFSGGGAIAQELALRHPERVRSLVLNGTFARVEATGARVVRGLQWIAERAPSERAFLEFFFALIYTPAFHESGAVDAIIEDVLADPHPQPLEHFQAQCAAFLGVDVLDRLHRIDLPTLVLHGDVDVLCPPHLGRRIAAAIPRAEFELLAGHAHQPFQEDPDGWNARVAAFWQRVERASRA